MNHAFQNQVALVTGAAAGIGLASARAFTQAEAAVAVIDIDENAVSSATEQLRSERHNAMAARCDVSDEDAVARVVQQTISKLGQLDIAFNNVGIQVPVPETGEDFDCAIAINLRRVWNCMKHELRHMRERGSGAIVNCSCQSGLIGAAGLGACTASKHGVVGLTKSAALEYAARGIRINSIRAGATGTPMVANALADEPDTKKAVMKEIPFSRLARPEEIATAVLWLRSPGAGFRVRQVIVPEGGFGAR
jgi:NAD(P)-dependent dehydrogenase (short-subunit alcohol dehydrogenase family)